MVTYQTLAEDGGKGELFMTLPPEVLDALGVELGDGLDWVFDGQLLVDLRRVPRVATNI